MASEALPPTMRAWTYNTRGTPSSVLTLNATFPTPPPPSGSNLLIRVSHAAINPATPLLLSLGISPLVRDSSIPASIPELDFAGTVHLAGPDAPERFQPGTRVFGAIPAQLWENLRRGVGTLAEFVVVNANVAAVLPEGMQMKDAGGLSLCGQTAVMMCEAAGIKTGLGQRVLVNGGSGGVGSMVCQIARAMGAAEVVATCSAGNVEMVKGFGVDEVVDYHEVAPLPAYLTATYSDRSFDAILDTVGTQALFKQCPGYLKPDGIYVNVGALEGFFWTLWCSFMNAMWPRFLGGTPRKYAFLSLVPSGNSAEKLAKMVEEGKLKAVVDSEYKMEDVLKAYDHLKSKTAKGKIVIKIESG